MDGRLRIRTAEISKMQLCSFFLPELLLLEEESESDSLDESEEDESSDELEEDEEDEEESEDSTSWF